jgi:UTP--glucose-1-phosphate uridylyltransferase
VNPADTVTLSVSPGTSCSRTVSALDERDHLYLSRGAVRCAQHGVERARAEGCAVSAVHSTREHMLPYYRTIGGRRLSPHPDLYEIENVVEKPTPSEAEQKLMVPGLRAGHYLCFFGIHVFTPAVLTMLDEAVVQSVGDEKITSLRC